MLNASPPARTETTAEKHEIGNIWEKVRSRRNEIETLQEFGDQFVLYVLIAFAPKRNLIFFLDYSGFVTSIQW